MGTHTRHALRTPRSADEIGAELDYKRGRATTLEARQRVVTEALATARGADAGAAIEITAELQTLMDEAEWIEHTLGGLHSELVGLDRAHQAAVVLLSPTANTPEKDTMHSPYAPENAQSIIADHGTPPLSTPAVRLTGRVRAYHRPRGFGFIIPDDGSRHLFFHKTALPHGSHVEVGQRVTYAAAIQDARGPRASDVVPIDPLPAETE